MMNRLPQQIELPNLLRSLLARDLRSAQIDRLVRYAVDLSITYLHWIVRKKGYQFQQLGMTLEDLAYDVVAELFAGEDEHCCTALRRSLQGGSAPQSEEALLAAFHALLFRNVQQRMGRIFAEINPLYRYLHNALRSYVQRWSDILILDALDGRWLCLRNADYARLEQPAMPLRELRQVIHPSLRYGRSTAVSVLIAVFAVLDAQDTYRKAILEEDVLRIARNLVRMELELEHASDNENGNTMDIGNISSIINETIDESRSWVEHKYVRLGRLTLQEVDLMFEAIRLYFRDIVQEGEAEGPYYYLRTCMPGLTHERFRASYRHKYEYILNRILERARKKVNDRFEAVQILQ